MTNICINPVNKELSRNENIAIFFSNLEFDFCVNHYISDFDGIENFSDLISELDNAFEENSQIIYYSKAIEYLKDNDPSLMNALSLASDRGLTVDKLNSETLAQLLKAENIRDEFWDKFEAVIDNFFDNLSKHEF